MTLNLSFCGCGFLGVYHLGVLSSLLKHGPQFMATVDRVAGASAGALAAALMVTCPTLQHVQTAKAKGMSMARRIRSKPLGAFTPGYQVTDDVDSLLNEMLPPQAHKLAEGRLFVSLTNVPSGHNEVVSRFDSRQDLIQVLSASCHIPVYSGAKFPKWQGKLYCDGGLTNNMVVFKDSRTVTVSPFSGQQDIAPQDSMGHGSKPMYFKLHNQPVEVNRRNAERFVQALFPPTLNVLQQYFKTGQAEADKFLVREGFYEK
ncbi:patatin-like phospholipase domain-containing protein 4 isoform X2 [Babylonia areolata]|uniref:patatin-like phospholipase domain-containing protein 4 isoform X1 n=1 Tax=Babylonia areolata TaxID=304850 RepID=UPI003FD679E3